MKKIISLGQKILYRMQKLSVLGRVLFIVFLCLLVSGIASGLVLLSNKGATEIPQHGGTYQEGIVGVPRFINPVLATSDADKDLTSLVYNGLVRKDEFGTFVPDLAESVEVDESGKTYTVTLKDHLFFHNGAPLTTEDVLFTVQKIQDSTLKSPLRVAWDGVDVTSEDQKTIVFRLQKPYAGFMQQLSVGILPQSLWKKIPTDTWSTSELNTKPIGSGPYKVVDVSHTRSGIPETFTLKSFKRFSGQRAYIKKIIVKTFANKTEAYHAFTHNNIDGLAMVDAKDISPKDVAGDQILTNSLPRVFSIFLNPSKNALFRDTTVVHALSLGIDRGALIEKIFNGYGAALNGPLPESVEDANDFTTQFTLAQNLLDKAGWKVNPDTGIREKTTSTTKGKTTTKSTEILSFVLSTANTPDLEASAQLIANAYHQLGVQVEIKVFEIGTLNESTIRKRDFEALLFGQSIKHDTDIYAFWHSSQKAAPGLNITGYTNKNVDSLLESALKEPDSLKRSEIYEKISTQLAKDAPVIFLYSPLAVTLMNSDVHHAVMPPLTNASDRFSLINTWYLYTDHVWNIFLKD